MTKETKDIPAFPSEFVTPIEGNLVIRSGHEGMTLRDYFAAKAMQSLIIRASNHEEVINPSAYAYQIADNMLGQRGIQATE